MSTTETEKEIEVVTGTIEGVTQKKPDTWQVEVRPDGSQYTKKLWSKDAELVSSLTEKLGQHGGFVCGASYWTNQDGKQVRSLWINTLDGNAEAGVQNAPPATTPDTAPAAVAAQATANLGAHLKADAMTKEEWARKDSAIHKMACIKTAADALKHTLPSAPTDEDIAAYLRNVSTLTLAWHRSVLAERDDPAGESVPFSQGAADHG